MTDSGRARMHRETVSLFLRTDLRRLEAELEERPWSEEIAARLTDHLAFAIQFYETILEGRSPRAPVVRQRIEDIRLENMVMALEALDYQTDSLLSRIETMEESELYSIVLDPFERGLSVVGHLYDFCRASAMLVEWARTQQKKEAEEGTLADLTGTDPIVFK